MYRPIFFLARFSPVVTANVVNGVMKLTETTPAPR